jgi:methylated-DNA-[protein]-cysteine S-methyltransferase
MTAYRATTTWDVYESPLGPVTLRTRPGGLFGVSFPGRHGVPAGSTRDPVALAPVAAQLEEYFGGERRAFDLPLDLTGSAFQQRVWRQLQEIPYGSTMTYTQLAESVGRPDIVRGVAAVVGQTPAPIVVPCHRVVAADGSLTGYRGGLERKAALLDLERRAAAGEPPQPAWAFRQLAML